MIGVAKSNVNVAEHGKGGGGVWEYVSASRLNTWLSCPLKFKLRYVDGIRTPTTRAMFLGKQVHAGLETYYRHRMLGITLDAAEVAGRMEDSWDAFVADEDMTFADTTEEQSLKQQAVDLVTTYLAQVPVDEPTPQAVEVTMEAPLIDPVTGEDLGIPLLGITDLVIDDDGPTIVDFKTASKSSQPAEISHEIQLTGYAYLFRCLTGEKESGLQIRSLIKTKKPKIEYHTYATRSEQHFARFFSIVREYLDALDSGRFNYRPGWGCAMCDHRDGPCRSWAG